MKDSSEYNYYPGPALPANGKEMSDARQQKAPEYSTRKYDESIRRQQEMLPSMDEMKTRWKEQVGIAMQEWERLSEADLLASEGHKKQLVDLLQANYTLSRDEANKQVNRFFEKHMSHEL